MCALLGLHSGKNANLFPCILGNWEKKRDKLYNSKGTSMHGSSMLVIENSPIIKNKKPMAKYVVFILTSHSPILLTDKNLFFHKSTFLCIF
jgi:hypothetical protein